MEDSKKIKVVIIDDDKEFLFALQEHLSFFPEIEIMASVTQYNQAKNILLNETPDLVFLDIEMPSGSGFQLLNEVRETSQKEFSVIFYTAYDKYVIQALRESAFDYILKPLKIEELRDAIERFKIKKQDRYKTTQFTMVPGFPEIISLPTSTGLKFIDKGKILLFQSTKESIFEKSSWETMFTDGSHLKLKTNTTAKEIIDFVGSVRFVQISQSAIVNTSFINLIEFKTHRCILMPPFHTIGLSVSRAYLGKLKDQCDLL